MWACAPAAVVLGCGAKPPAGPVVGVSTNTADPPPGEQAAYRFDPLDDDRPVSSEAMAGKPTIIAFVTTGDIVGQAQVSYLVQMSKRDGDEVNYVMVAVHPRREIVLVEAYRKTLDVDFPVALAPPEATRAGGPFGEIPAVPTTVVLDRSSRVVWKHTGLAKSDEIRAQMRGL